MQIIKRGLRRRVLVPRRWIHCSARTIEGRFHFAEFAPSFIKRVWGIIGRGLRRYRVELAQFVLLSNHYHCLVRARRGRAISLFNQYVKAGLARLAHEFHRTRGPVWDGPFRATSLLDDASELHWFGYVTMHGTKEGLVASPTDWPGVHGARAIIAGRAEVGVWFDRPGWLRARRDRPDARKADFMRPVAVPFTPLSRWRLDEEAWRHEVRAIVDHIVADHAHQAFAGRAAVRQVEHTHVPKVTKRSRCATFDARGATAKALLAEAYEARRYAMDNADAVLAALVADGREAGSTLDDWCQWPALIADHLGELDWLGEFMPT